jgi:hypothetical protein
MANFYTDSKGADEGALSVALAHLRSLAPRGTAGIFLMAKANLQDEVSFGERIGRSALRRLVREGAALALGLTFVLLTSKQGKRLSFPGPVLALHVSLEALRMLDAPDIIFVPWSKDDGESIRALGAQWTRIF